MNDVSWIGYWAIRRNSKGHLVESEVTDRLVMRCGRQMKLVTARGHLQFFQTWADPCRQCSGDVGLP